MSCLHDSPIAILQVLPKILPSKSHPRSSLLEKSPPLASSDTFSSKLSSLDSPLHSPDGSTRPSSPSSESSFVPSSDAISTRSSRDENVHHRHSNHVQPHSDVLEIPVVTTPPSAYLTPTFLTTLPSRGPSGSPLIRSPSPSVATPAVLPPVTSPHTTDLSPNSRLWNRRKKSTRTSSVLTHTSDNTSDNGLAIARPVDADEWNFGKSKQLSSEKPQVVVTSADVPALILPTPPTDGEKVLYSKTHRFGLYLFGTISFLSVSVGMWFFAISAREFVWFAVAAGLIQIYLIISYTVGYVGKDFDLKVHEDIIERNPLTDVPSVDIYLPCCKEPLEILENTYKYVSQIDYANFKVHVLDDGGLDSVKQLAERYGFNYISRDNKPYLKKAGNLRYAFTRTSGDFFVIYDADFCPRPDFIRTTLPYMKEYKDLAILQSPQFFRPQSIQTWVEQGASSTQELFYRVVQVNRDRWGAAICVGSNAVYRRAALEAVGGTAEIGHSEDVHTGFYSLTRGWKVKYIPLALACGVSPDTPKAFFSQQMRWCAGSTTLLTNLDFWKSDLSVIQKICYLSGMMYYSAAAFMIFMNPLPGLLLTWIIPNHVLWYNCSYAIPSLIYSVFVYRLWSRQRYNFNVNFVFVIQQYAYFMAVKDRIFGTTAAWVPSGDSQSHNKVVTTEKKAKTKGANNKYRNMRIMCFVWNFATVSGMIAGVTLRVLQGHPWYNFFPALLLDAFNCFLAHRFIFYSH